MLNYINYNIRIIIIKRNIKFILKLIKNNFNIFWGLGIGDWGLGIGPNPQSPIPNPQLFKKYYINKILLN